MRIFDPKDQLGNSLLSSADTQKSSVKLEKQMTVGGGAITLTSTDISDIENWELSNARVKVDGQMISFLPDTSRGTNGDLTVDFGTYFPNAVLILKRTVFDGMKQEEEEITIEVEIRQLMEKTMAAATAPTPRTDEEIQENIAEWKAMGQKAHDSDPEGKYKNATLDTLEGYLIDGKGVVEVNDCFLSVDTLASLSRRIVVGSDVTAVKWHSDLPSFAVTFGSQDLMHVPLVEWTGKLPNIQDASFMFAECSQLTSWNVELPNSLTNVSSMFQGCSALTSWNVELPNSITNASCMFYGCYGLTSFSTPSGTLPSSITNVYGMFELDHNLREFTPSLSGLTNCEKFDNMFQECILNEASIRNILGTLPNRKGKGQLIIRIGCDKTMEDSVKQQLGSLAQSVSTEKKWNVVLSWNPQY